MRPENLHISDLHPLFPIAQIFRAIETRLEALEVGVTFEALRDHVLCCEAAKASQEVLLPYFQAYVAQALDARGTLRRAHCNYLRDAMRVLELAIFACEQALALKPKNTRVFLEEALELLGHFDMLQIDYEQHRRTIRAARVRGGVARQAALEPARHRAARLLLVKAPPTGWTKPEQAARMIEPDVAAFVHRRRMSMTGVRVTIRKWIATHPVVREAYEKSRRPPAP